MHDRLSDLSQKQLLEAREIVITEANKLFGFDDEAGRYLIYASALIERICAKAKPLTPRKPIRKAVK